MKMQCRGFVALTDWLQTITMHVMVEMKDSSLFDSDEDDFDTVMASDISFKGKIRFAKPFMIKGRVDGRIDATSDLLIDTGATVNADIVANKVMVRGKVKGNINGKKLVYVTSTGSVTGDIMAAQVVLDHGSSFTGRCSMIKDAAVEDMA